MADKFTMFPVFGDAALFLNEEEQDLFFVAVSRYGLFGQEIDLPPKVMGLFVFAKEQIDNSKNAIKQGKKGGAVKQSNTPYQTETTPLEENFEPPLEKNEKGACEKSGSQTNTNQTNTNQTNKRERRLSPPTREQVREYAVEIELSDNEADAFIDHFTANGWKVGGKAPMKDWKAALRNWKRRSGEFRREEVVFDDEYSRF